MVCRQSAARHTGSGSRGSRSPTLTQRMLPLGATAPVLQLARLLQREAAAMQQECCWRLGWHCCGMAAAAVASKACSRAALLTVCCSSCWTRALSRLR
jgi:hypothetical protein